eukprot:UN02080
MPNKQGTTSLLHYTPPQQTQTTNNIVTWRRDKNPNALNNSAQSTNLPTSQPLGLPQNFAPLNMQTPFLTQPPLYMFPFPLQMPTLNPNSQPLPPQATVPLQMQAPMQPLPTQLSQLQISQPPKKIQEQPEICYD